MSGCWRLRAGWLVDGTGAPPRRDICLAVEDGRLSAVVPASDTAVGGFDVDFGEATVIPGLIDCHLHLFMSATADEGRRRSQLTEGYAVACQGIERRLERLLACGVVAVRDGGDRHGHALRFTQIGGEWRPMVCCAGVGWHAAGRYGKLIARSPAVSLPESVIRDHRGGQWVKIVNSGLNSLTEFGRQGPPQFAAAELVAAVAAAGEKGKSVMVHANGESPVRQAVEAGCRSIEHGFFMGRENLDRMADKGTFWVPTAVTMQGLAKRVASGLADEAVCRRNLDHQLDQLAAARRKGVRVATGTDAGTVGVAHGPAMAEEMRLLVSAGFDVAQAVHCGTAAGADLLGLPDLGRLVAGRAATFVVVQGPPERLLQNIRQPLAVCFDGCWTSMGVPITSVHP